MSDTDRRVGHRDAARRAGTDVVLARPGDAGASAYCQERLAPDGRPPAAPIVVLLDGDGDPAAARRGRHGVVVAVGDELRTGADAAADAGPPGRPAATVTVPDDLGLVGRTVDEYLTAWSSAGYRPAVCVDSLSGLLARGTIVGAYRFLYVLDRRLARTGGDLHLHVDPGAHEEEILRTFLVVAERTVSFGDGQPLL